MSAEQHKPLPPFAGFSTTAIHVGQEPDPRTGAVVVPISLATTFHQASPGVPTEGWEYARSDNPTRHAFELQIAACEGGKHGMAFASGLAASTAILSLLPKDSHIVTEEDLYGGTGRLLSRVFSNFTLETTMVDFTQPDLIEAAVKPGQTKMLWLETPTNPMLKVVDIAAVAKVAAKHNLLLVVDNTFMSPYFQRPLDLGAHIVLHSISKYINGHSDVIGGVVVCKDDSVAERVRFFQNAMGGILSPFDSYMASRGLKTLAVRMRQHEINATAVARYLSSHPRVARVIYPGLPSHPQHAVAAKQQTGFGGMVSVVLKGGLQQARVFLERVKVFCLAESLGGVESLIEHPAIMTHASVPAERRARLGISDAMVRMSCGIEDTSDLLADLEQALAAVPESE